MIPSPDRYRLAATALSHRAPVRFLLAAALLLPTLLVPGRSSACGGKAVPPSCGRTVVLTATAPTDLLTTDTSFDLEVLVYLGLAEFPPGSGLCPAGPFDVDLDVTVTCTPSGDGSGSVSDIPITPGYTPITVPITLAAGPSRSCVVDTAATVGFGDGSTATASNDRIQVCLVEPAPALPTLPRLDLQMLSPDGLVQVHPGDASSHLFRITNNDATESFEGTFEATTFNVSKVPTSSGITDPLDGVFSTAEPGEGDNFPMDFADQVLACVQLPPDPPSFLPPVIDRTILLPPGGFVDIEVLTRPWGMCADGSCSQSKVTLTGEFSNLDPGLACAPFATVTHLPEPPSFAWTDAGSSALFLPPADPSAGILPFQALTQPGLEPARLLGQLLPPVLEIPGFDPLPGQLVADQLDPERGRFRVIFPLPEPMQANNLPILDLQMQFFPDPEGDVIAAQLESMGLVAGAPAGFDLTQPLFMGQLGIVQPLDAVTIPGLFDLTLQITLQPFGPGGQPIDPLGASVQHLLVPPDGSRLELGLQALVPEGGMMIEALQIDLDLRAHGSAGIDPSSVHGDDFESGDLGGWSSATGG